MSNFSKKSILKKTFEVGTASVFSKFLGIIREVLQIKYLGVKSISDAFTLSYRIPNTLRKIFAEGALSASLIPNLVKIVKDDNTEKANKLVSLMMLTIGSLVFSICLLIFAFPKSIILLFAPGFANKTTELVLSVKLVRILVFFIFFISMGSILTAAMQAKRYFTIPALGPVLLNIVYISGLLVSINFNLSVSHFALFLLLGGFLQLVLFFYYYFKINFGLAWPDKTVIKDFKEVIVYKFIPCLFSVSALEINLLIDARFASNLPPGSITLVNLASRFMGIVLGAFAVAFSSILLSHFSRISIYAPKRLSFYLLESSKFLFWVTVPVSLIMSFFSYEIFYTIFYQLTDKISLAQISEASSLLTLFVIGLFFYSLNKLLLSIYYSMHQALLPTLVSLIGSVFNFTFNWLFVSNFGTLGIVVGTTLSAVLQSVLFILLLYKKFNFVLYLKKFQEFLFKYFLQLFITSSLFYLIYKLFVYFIKNHLSFVENFLLNQIGLWLWIGPLVLLMFWVLYSSRKLFGIKVYFLG